MAAQKFTATIYKIGINPVVDPPEKVLIPIFLQAGKDKGPIPVCGKLNGAAFIQTLVKYRGAWRLYINGPMLKDSGLAVGDGARVEIEFDPNPREVPMREEFAKALKKEPDTKKHFLALAPSRQKEILKYLSFLKSDDAVRRNVEKVVAQLRGGKPAVWRKPRKY